jgi:hypothetical protein
MACEEIQRYCSKNHETLSFFNDNSPNLVHSKDHSLVENATQDLQPGAPAARLGCEQRRRSALIKCWKLFA